MVDLSKRRFEKTITDNSHVTIHPFAMRLERLAAKELQRVYGESLGLNEASTKHWESLARIPDAPGAVSLTRLAHRLGCTVSPPPQDNDAKVGFVTVSNKQGDVIFTLKVIRLGDLDTYRAGFVERANTIEKKKAGRPPSQKESSTKIKRDPDDKTWIVDGSEFVRVAEQRKLSIQQLADILCLNVTTVRRWYGYDRVAPNITMTALTLAMISQGKYAGIYANDMITLDEFEHLKKRTRQLFLEEARGSGKAPVVTKAALFDRQEKRKKKLADDTGGHYEIQEASSDMDGAIEIWNKGHVKAVMERLLKEYEQEFGVPRVGLPSKGAETKQAAEVPTFIQRRPKSDPFFNTQEPDYDEDPAYNDPAYMEHLAKLRREEEQEISALRSKKSSAELWAERKYEIDEAEAHAEVVESVDREHWAAQDAEEKATRWADSLLDALRKLRSSENNGPVTNFLVSNLSAVSPDDLKGFLYDVMFNHMMAEFSEQEAKRTGPIEADLTNVSKPQTLEDLQAISHQRSRPVISGTAVIQQNGLVGRIKRG